MEQSFYCPDVPILLFFPRGNLRFGTVQHRFHMRHRVVPTKAERWQQLINGICLRSRKKKADNAGRENSAYRSTVPIRGAICLPVPHLRVRRPHFRSFKGPRDTLEARKLRARVDTVKSKWLHEPAPKISSGMFFLFSLGHARFFF